MQSADRRRGRRKRKGAPGGGVLSCPCACGDGGGFCCSAYETRLLVSLTSSHRIDSCFSCLSPASSDSYSHWRGISALAYLAHIHANRAAKRLFSVAVFIFKFCGCCCWLDAVWVIRANVRTFQCSPTVNSSPFLGFHTFTPSRERLKSIKERPRCIYALKTDNSNALRSRMLSNIDLYFGPSKIWINWEPQSSKKVEMGSQCRQQISRASSIPFWPNVIHIEFEIKNLQIKNCVQDFRSLSRLALAHSHSPWPN